MAQDLKKLFEERRKNKSYAMKDGHEERFLEKLDTTLAKKKKANSFNWLKIAASVAIVLGVASYLFISNKEQVNPDTTIVTNTDKETILPKISLGDLSPDLEKIENYYTANINLELASLNVSDDNKDIVDSYMEQLADLDNEYKRLNKELNEIGPNDQTIEALIKNLQLRLELLKKLKEKLNQLKLSKNEQEIII